MSKLVSIDKDDDASLRAEIKWKMSQYLKDIYQCHRLMITKVDDIG